VDVASGGNNLPAAAAMRLAIAAHAADDSIRISPEMSKYRIAGLSRLVLALKGRIYPALNKYKAGFVPTVAHARSK
jgi:hypothetical protein